jgi:hypothetical protein
MARLAPPAREATLLTEEDWKEGGGSNGGWQSGGTHEWISFSLVFIL